MNYEDIAQARRIIRGYKSDTIPRETLEEIIHIAKQSPSSMNTQPWHFHVLTGEPLERIRKGNTEKMMAGSSVDREI
jgi:nitroreductase